MNKMINLALLFFLLTGCTSSLLDGSSRRHYQGKVMQSIRDKGQEFTSCAHENGLFDAMKSSRVRVALSFSLDAKGDLLQFKTDKRPYPSDFVSCLFAVLETIDFPEFEQEGSEASFNQPFIFRKK